MVLNFDDAPDDPVKRLFWLSELETIVREEIDAECSRAYFLARTQGTMAAAIEVGPKSRKAAYAMTRHQNEMRGRTIRWKDA